MASYPVTLIVAHSVLKFATEDIKQEVLGGVVAAGTTTSIAMSEPGSGSDVGVADLQGREGRAVAT